MIVSFHRLIGEAVALPSMCFSLDYKTQNWKLLTAFSA